MIWMILYLPSFLHNSDSVLFPHKIPEAMENFTITLLNATGGARLGNILDASLHINKNDNPIYFAGEDLLELHPTVC